MKLMIFLSITCMLQATASSYAQQVSYSGKNVLLEKVFKAIESQTGYVVFYNYSALHTVRIKAIEARQMPLEAFLNKCFEEQPLKYTIQNKTIVISPREEKNTREPTIILLADEPPPTDIKGRVVNDKGEAVEGASVQVKGSATKGTTTNANGNFILKGVEENATIVISALSIETYEVKLNGRTDLATLTVKTKTTALAEVKIVSTGYQDIPKERATGSFSSPDKQMFESRVSTDVLSRLNGITNGIVFDQSSGNRAGISIRGRSTIFASTEPLIVLDNFPYDGNISNINPNDIETVTLLKDAAAASIWGVRAGNGVIVITTKSGKFNKPLKVEFNANTTIGEKPDLFYNPDFLDAYNFIDVEKLLFARGFYDADLNSPLFPAISPVVEILAKQRAGQITQAEADAQINAYSSADIRKDLTQYMYRKPVNQQYAISLSGGGISNSYFFSIGYDNNHNSGVGNNLQRVTINAFNNFQVLKKIQFSIGANYIQRITSSDNTPGQIRTGGSGTKSIYPYAQLVDAGGNSLPILKDYRSSFAAGAPSKGFLNWQFNPLDEIGLNSSNTTTNDIRFLAGIKYNIIKGLSAEAKYQYQHIGTEGKNLADVNSYSTRNLINSLATVTNGTVTKLDNVPIGAVLNLSNNNTAIHNIRATLNYDNAWGQNRLTAIGGVEAREVRNDGNTNTLFGYDDVTAAFTTTNFTGGTAYPSNTFTPLPVTTAVTSTIDRFRSYFGNAAYTYRNKYTLSASGRIDQSNLFGVKTNQRTVPLWSTGAKWDLSKEPFYHLNWLPLLSLRATYGFNGNADRTLTAFTTARYFNNAIFTGSSYAIIQSPPNPELRWEKSSMINIGIDFALKNNNISGSIEYFQKKGIDLIGDVLLAPSTGFVNPILGGNSVRGNFSNMSGKGVDIQVQTKNINKAFKWDTRFLFSYASDQVTRYDRINTPRNLVSNGDGTSGLTFPLVGKPVFALYSYSWGGLDPANGDPQGYIVKDTLSKDYNKLVDPASVGDIVYNGPAAPRFFGGIINSFSYKGFTVTASVNYKLGYYFRRSSISYGSLFTRWQGHKDYANRWQKPGDETNTFIPSLQYPITTANRDVFYRFSEVLVEKGDHLRLQDISLNYQFTRKTLGRLFIRQLEVYFYANNLGILWRANKQQLDPDAEQSRVPAARTYSFGIRAGF